MSAGGHVWSGVVAFSCPFDPQHLQYCNAIFTLSSWLRDELACAIRMTAFDEGDLIATLAIPDHEANFTAESYGELKGQMSETDQEVGQVLLSLQAEESEADGLVASEQEGPGMSAQIMSVVEAFSWGHEQPQMGGGPVGRVR